MYIVITPLIQVLYNINIVYITCIDVMCTSLYWILWTLSKYSVHYLYRYRSTVSVSWVPEVSFGGKTPQYTSPGFVCSPVLGNEHGEHYKYGKWSYICWYIIYVDILYMLIYYVMYHCNLMCIYIYIYQSYISMAYYDGCECETMSYNDCNAHRI